MISVVVNTDPIAGLEFNVQKSLVVLVVGRREVGAVTKTFKSLPITGPMTGHIFGTEVTPRMNLSSNDFGTSQGMVGWHLNFES